MVTTPQAETEPQRFSPADERLGWAGALSVEHGPHWVRPWRLPRVDRDLFADALVEQAVMPAGVRLTFRSDTTLLAGQVEFRDDLSPVDLFLDGEFAGSHPMDGRSSFAFSDLPARTKLVELWLPQFGEFRLRDLWLSSGASLEAAAPERPRWVVYGSSITQCQTAASPSTTWPALVARRRDLDLTCLGFGGQCHLEASMARVIRDLPAALISICAGVNVYGQSSLTPRTFRSSLIGFVQVVRDAHVDTPIVIMSPIASPDRETVRNAAGFTLDEIRGEVAAAADVLIGHGDRNLHYIDGLDVFGLDLAAHLGDGLHPDAEGYSIIAGRYDELIARRQLFRALGIDTATNEASGHW